MKILLLVLVTAISVQAQRDWTELFPEIPGCVRNIQPMIRINDTVEQTAVYKVGDESCGSVAFRREPGLFPAKRKLYTTCDAFPSTWIKFRGYATFQESPLCGNDEWIGSLEIFFEKDKAMTVSASRWGLSIMEFAQKQDFKKLGKMMK
jgi:hypothetical protein